MSKKAELIAHIAEVFVYNCGCFIERLDAVKCARLLRDPTAKLEGHGNEWRIYLPEQSRYFWPVDSGQMLNELLSVNRASPARIATQRKN